VLPSIDLYAQKQKKRVSICNSKLQTIAHMPEAEGIFYTINDVQLNELSFRVPLTIDDLSTGVVANPHIEKLQDRTIIKLAFNTDIEYFVITAFEDTNDEYRNIQCYSLGYQLNDRFIKNYKSMDYVEIMNPTTGAMENKWMTSPVNIQVALEDALQRHRAWNVIDIDPDLMIIKRYFEFDSITPLEFVYQIAEKFNAIIEWHTQQQGFSVYHIDNYGQDRGFRITDENYIDSVVRKSSQDNFCTRLFLYGKDGITINEITSLGQSYIEDYSYFYNVMSPELYTALTDYQSYVQSREGEFPALLTQLNTAQSEMSTLEFEMSTLKNKSTMQLDLLDLKRAAGDFYYTNARVTGATQTRVGKQLVDGTNYIIIFKYTYADMSITYNSLPIGASDTWLVIRCVPSNTMLDVTITSNDVSDMEFYYIEVSPDEYANATDTVLIDKYLTVKLDETISAKQSEINSKQSEINGIQSQISNLQDDLNIEYHLTVDQLNEFDQFIIEKEYFDDNLTTPEELLAEGQKQMMEKRIPEMSSDLSLMNFLELLEEKRNWHKLFICDTVRLQSKKLNADIKAKVTSIRIDDDSIGLTIANKKVKDEGDKFTSLVYKATRATNTLNKSANTWNQIEVVKSDFDEYSTSPIDAYKQGISSGDKVAIDERGLVSSTPTDPNKSVIMNNGIIASIKDGENWDIAVDSEGVKPEALKKGTVTVTDTMQIKNEQNTVSMNGSNLTVNRNNLSVNGTVNVLNASLQSGWVTHGTGYAVQYHKDPFGIVRLRGRMKSGLFGEIAFVLPVGYRPSKEMMMTTYTTSDATTQVSRFIIYPNGEVRCWAANNLQFCFDGVTFLAEQ
jgi:phage minor structural protein